MTRIHGLSAREQSIAQARMAKQLTDKSDEELSCRAMRHSWAKIGSARIVMPTVRYGLPEMRIEWGCTRGCKVIRRDRMTLRKHRKTSEYTMVERLSPIYLYPDTYQLQNVPRGTNRSGVLWSEFVRRELAGQVDTLSVADDVRLRDVTA